jgi:hypothetical protein
LISLLLFLIETCQLPRGKWQLPPPSSFK